MSGQDIGIEIQEAEELVLVVQMTCKPTSWKVKQTFLMRAVDCELPLKQGDKVVVPAKVLHAEGAVQERVVYILALAQPLLSEDFLAMHNPDELAV